MKKRILIISSIIVLLIIVLWFVGIIPKQIGKMYGTKYMKDNFPKMQLEYVNIEWNKYYGDYIITFKDEDNKTYSCVIAPKYFPINIGQGINAIIETYQEKYSSNTSLSIPVWKSVLPLCFIKKWGKMEELLFYTVNRNYIKYLSKFEKHVSYNKDEIGHSRPYLGIVLKIENYEYFVPLYSYREEKWI